MKSIMVIEDGKVLVSSSIEHFTVETVNGQIKLTAVLSSSKPTKAENPYIDDSFYVGPV